MASFSTPSPAASGVRSPSYQPSVRDLQFSRGNPRSNRPVADTAALLLRAAYDGDIPQVQTLAKRLRKAGKTVEEAMEYLKGPRYKGQGPLHMAASGGMAAMCKFLIKYLKLDVDSAGDNDHTPLVLAIYRCASPVIARILLDHRAHPNKEGKDGLTPLHAATARDNYEAAELLLSRRAYVDPVTKSGATPLYITARNGNARMMELLLRHQADAGADAITPLIAAATAGSTECVKCLLEAGADPNVSYSAVENNPNDSALVCKALDDANAYKDMRPNLSKSCYPQGAALILVKEYGRATKALMSGLKLDFGTKRQPRQLSGDHA